MQRKFAKKKGIRKDHGGFIFTSRGLYAIVNATAEIELFNFTKPTNLSSNSHTIPCKINTNTCNVFKVSE